MTEMDSPAPTWATNTDRVVYLLVEYRTPISIVVLAAGIWTSFFVQTVPSPPGWLLPVIASVAVLGIPSYFVMLWMFRRLHSPSGVMVGVVDPGDPEIDDQPEVVGGVEVPPDMWSARDETGFTAMEVPDAGSETVGSFDFLVTRFNHMDSLGQIEVRGCEQSTLSPAQRATNAKHAEEVYEHMHTVRRKYANLKATLHGRATDLHDAVVMSLMLEGERAELVPEAQPTKQIEEMEQAVDGLPDAPESDPEPPEARAMGMGQLDADELPGPGTYDGPEEALENAPEEARTDA